MMSNIEKMASMVAWMDRLHCAIENPGEPIYMKGDLAIVYVADSKFFHIAEEEEIVLSFKNRGHLTSMAKTIMAYLYGDLAFPL